MYIHMKKSAPVKTSEGGEEKDQKSETIEFTIPKPSFRGNPYTTPFLVILLMVVSFLLGSLFTKVQYLEHGGTILGGQTATPTPSTVSDMFMSYAKKMGLNSKQFNSCLSSGKYREKIQTESQLGSSLGVRGTPGFFINGKFLGGAYPFDTFKEIIDKELDGTASTNYKDYSQTLQAAYESPQGKAFDPEPKTIDIGNSPVRGNAKAQVVIVEFSDFQCPFCKQANPIVQQVMKEYGDKVKLIYKHLPLTSIHPNAQIGAEAAECANEQKKFWQFHDVLFNNQAEWSSLPATIPTINSTS